MKQQYYQKVVTIQGMITNAPCSCDDPVCHDSRPSMPRLETCAALRCVSSVPAMQGNHVCRAYGIPMSETHRWPLVTSILLRIARPTVPMQSQYCSARGDGNTPTTRIKDACSYDSTRWTHQGPLAGKPG